MDLHISATDSSVDQQHPTTFCAFNHVHRSDKAAILMIFTGSEVWVIGFPEDMGTNTGLLRSEVARSGVPGVKTVSARVLVGVERFEELKSMPRQHYL